VKRKLNIAFFTDSYKPNNDGVVVSIELLRKNLPKHNALVKLIVCPKKYYEKEKVENVDGTKIIKISGLYLPFYKDYSIAFISHFSAMELLKREKIDILHNHGLGFTALSSVIAAKKIGIKSIITFHTNVLEATHYLGIFEKPVKQILRSYLSYLLKLHDAVVVPSKKIKKLVNELGIRKNVFIIPTGVDLNDFKNAKNNELEEKLKKLKNDDVVLLFVGRIVKEKNIDFLIECFYEAKKMKNEKKLKDMQLWIVGDGPYLNELKNKHSNSHSIKFFGYVNRNELTYYYRLADALVFTSFFDTQGIVVFEAIAHKLPIIALKNTSAEEIAKKYGAIFKGKTDFLNAIKKAIKKRFEVPDFIYIEETCKKYMKVYKKILKESKENKKQL
jgi:1,2-diacylglycerol 3-alpha-glucosyltransferase